MRRVFDEFARSEVVGSVLIVCATVAALVWANSPWAGAYSQLLHAEVGLVLGQTEYVLSLSHLINDGLMVLFFLAVGLEMKREVLIGELSAAHSAILPVVAALGGMIVPALIYLALNWGAEGMRGWGIPMATDVTLTLGVLALLGKRVPTPLKVFLVALAISDDIGAVLVKLIYATDVNLVALSIAGVLLLGLVAANRRGVRHIEVYVLLGLGVWLAVLASGIHATLAGILVALTIPVRTRADPSQLIAAGRASLDELERAELTHHSMVLDRQQLDTINTLFESARDMRPTGLVLEEYLHPLTMRIILPLFALFNTGIHFEQRLLESLTNPVALGIILGLVLGKPIGITLFSWLALRTWRVNLPAGVSWRQLHGVSWLCGIGFTLSLYVTALAFSDEALVTHAKVGILIASPIAGIIGYLLLRRRLPAPESTTAVRLEPTQA
jgi:NhaA family Na+:H+ antiporter